MTASSAISFKTRSTSQVGSASGIKSPMMNGSNLSKFQFSCALPPVVFLETNLHEIIELSFLKVKFFQEECKFKWDNAQKQVVYDIR